MDIGLKNRIEELSNIKDNLMAQLQSVIGRIDEIKELGRNGYYLAKKKASKNGKATE